MAQIPPKPIPPRQVPPKPTPPNAMANKVAGVAAPAPAAPAATAVSAANVVARASREYRFKRLIIVAMLVGMGAWFGYDGFIGWPKENQQIKDIEGSIEPARREIERTTDPERRRSETAKVVELEAKLGKLQKHSESDLGLQRILCYTLPPLGFVVLGWSLYRSRGSYRLSNKTLHAPGHPPVPLDAIRSIDKTDWDRKGIAHVNYELANGDKGTVTLDDFIYDRPPTDEIFRWIEVYTGTGDADAAPA